MHQIEIHGLKIIYNNENIKIVDSYKINTEYLMKYILLHFIKETNYKSKRSIESWIREWKFHNTLYRLGLFKSHTRDCDLEENESKIRLLIYWIFER